MRRGSPSQQRSAFNTKFTEKAPNVHRRFGSTLSPFSEFRHGLGQRTTLDEGITDIEAHQAPLIKDARRD